jgi:anti-sigma factor RsiW
MMTCWSARTALVAYHDGELEPTQAHRLETHLRGCPRCQSERQQLRQVNLLLRSLPVPSRSERYWPQAMQQLRSKTQELPQTTTSALFGRFDGFVESLPRTLLPMTLVGAALVNAVAILGLEEETLSLLSSYLLPLVLG